MMDAARLIIEIEGGDDFQSPTTTTGTPPVPQPVPPLPPHIPPPKPPDVKAPEPPQPNSPRIVIPSAGPLPPIQEQFDAVLESLKSKKASNLGGLDANILRTFPEEEITRLYRSLRAAAESAESMRSLPAPPASSILPPGPSKPPMNRPGGTEPPERPPEPAKNLVPTKETYPLRDFYGFQKPQAPSIYEFAKPTSHPVTAENAATKPIPLADSTYNVQPPEPPPGSPPPDAKPGWSGNPVAKPVPEAMPTAKVVDRWAGWKSGESLKNFMPGFIRQNFDAIKGGFTSASAEAGAAGAGAASRAVAGVGGAVAAAGPAAALLAVEFAAQVVSKKLNHVAEQTERVGEGFAKLASNDHMGMFRTAVDFATSELEEVPVVGKVWAAELRATVAPIKAFHAVTQAFVQRAEELRGYSGPLASATAQADLRTLQADIREGQRLGPALSRLVEAQSRADNEIREILLPVKEVLVNVVARILEAGLASWESMKPTFSAIGEGVPSALEILGKIYLVLAGPIAGAITGDIGKKAADRLRDMMKPKEDGGAGPIQEWLDAANNLGRNQLQPPNDGAQRKVAGPIFDQWGI